MDPGGREIETFRLLPNVGEEPRPLHGSGVGGERKREMEEKRGVLTGNKKRGGGRRAAVGWGLGKEAWPPRGWRAVFSSLTLSPYIFFPCSRDQ